jgi:hypothetical protein
MDVPPAYSDTPPKYAYDQPNNAVGQQPQSRETTSSGQYPNYPPQLVVPWGYQAPYQEPHQYPQPPAPPQQQQQQEQQQQQSQQVLVINNYITVAPVLIESFYGQILASCIVLWFISFPFGLIGYLLAASARARAVSDPLTANRLGRASYRVSIGGGVLTVVTVTVVLAIFCSTPTTPPRPSLTNSGVSVSTSTRSICVYPMYGSCYNHRDCTTRFADCVKSIRMKYFTPCCYYN